MGQPLRRDRSRVSVQKRWTKLCPFTGRTKQPVRCGALQRRFSSSAPPAPGSTAVMEPVPQLDGAVVRAVTAVRAGKAPLAGCENKRGFVGGNHQARVRLSGTD